MFKVIEKVYDFNYNCGCLDRYVGYILSYGGCSWDKVDFVCNIDKEYYLKKSEGFSFEGLVSC